MVCNFGIWGKSLIYFRDLGEKAKCLQRADDIFQGFGEINVLFLGREGVDRSVFFRRDLHNWTLRI